MTRFYAIAVIGGLLFIGSACRPAAGPISVGNKPVSVNDVPLNDAMGQPRRPVSEMSWTAFDGTVYKLKDFQGKVVILDFWATYCPPCIEGMKHLNSLQQKYGEDRLVVVGLHVGGDEDKPKIPEFIKRLSINYRLGYPEDDLTSFVFGQQSAIPQTAIFDAKGTLIKKLTGFNDSIKVEINQAVETALQQNG